MATLLLVSLFFAACSRKEKRPEENLTPANALQQYGGVMGKTYQRAKALEVILPTKQLLESFRAIEGRYPYSLEELVEKGYCRQLPTPPEGLRFKYDPQTGSIGLE